MKKFGLGKYFISLGVFIGLALTPLPVFAQHGGGGHSSGGGGGFHGGGGGFHSSGTTGGGFSRSGAGEARGGAEGRGFQGGTRPAGGSSSYRGAEAGRGAASSSNLSRSQASNIRPPINDGQWHSFGNSSRAGSSLVARNTGTTEGFRSFGASRAEAGFVGGGFRGAGFGFRGGFGGFGFGRGCCWGGWGFGIGFPYWGFGWGPAWAFWNPWWYGPYGYGPYYGGWTGYYGGDYGYDDYSDVWSSNPPPYRPDDSPNNDNSASQGNNQIYPARPNPDDDGFNVNPGSDSLHSAKNGASPRNSNVPNAAPRVQTSVVVPAVI